MYNEIQYGAAIDGSAVLCCNWNVLAVRCYIHNTNIYLQDLLEPSSIFLKLLGYAL